MIRNGGIFPPPPGIPVAFYAGSLALLKTLQPNRDYVNPIPIMVIIIIQDKIQMRGAYK
jgi:hypothetical protein